ncbi:MAG: hypothetical protein ACRDDY_00650 [Clostridium sp.]|uniref:hypothetical protein n=1 Tax=Clostridium sp. TaxID=1506 RepID=UPI003EE42B4E
MINVKEKIFIGARDLGAEQAKKILPTYDLVLKQIDEFEKAAINSKNESGQKDFNNTISLWGPRGTGKTSILYTIHNELRKKGKKNIILNIVDPDNFSDLTRIIGVILGSFREWVNENIEKHISDNGFKYCNDDKFKDYFNNGRYIENSNPLKIKLDELLKVYCYIDEEYRKLLTQNFTNIERYKNEYRNLLSPDINFKKVFLEFIDKLVEVNNRINQIDENHTTMIFITIDDADLKQEKCKEIIETIMKYICHKNIVCLISGDYEIFSDSVTLSLVGSELLKSQYANEDGFLNSGVSISKRKNYLSGEYLKKIIPPSFRHNLIKWDLESIPNFSFEVNEMEFTLVNGLKKLLNGENSIFSYQLDNGKIITPRIAYSIFDNTPRGLINVFYALDKVNNKEFKEIKAFIDTIVESASFLNKYKKEFLGECLIWGDSFENTRIDYNKFKKFEVVKEENLREKTLEEKRQIIKDNNKKNIIFFIILELVKKINKEIKFDKIDYIEVKEKILYLIINNKEKNEIEIDANLSDYNQSDFKKSLYYLDDLILKLDLEIVFVLLEKLTEIRGFSFDKLNNDEMKKEIYVAINDFIGINNENKIEESTFLIDVIAKNKNSGNLKRYEKFIEFMDNISIKSSRYDNLDKLLNEKIGWVTKLVQNSKIELICKAPIYNLIERIRNEKIVYEEIPKIKEVFPKAEKYRLVLEKIKNKKDFDEKEKSYIKKIIGKLSGNSEIKIESLIESVFFKVSNDNTIGFKINIKEIQEEIDKFINNQNHGTKSKFKSIQEEFQREGLSKKNNITYAEYNNIFNKLDKINSRVWYGRTERFELEVAIINKAILSKESIIYIYVEIWKKINDEKIISEKNMIINNSDVLINYIKYIINLEIEFMERFNSDIIVEKNLDNLRESYIKLFDNCYKKAMNMEKGNLEVLGLEFEDTEENENNQEINNG